MDGSANHHYGSGGLRLAAHLETPDPEDVVVNGDPQSDEGIPAVVICHGFPSGPGGGANSPATFPELARRISRQLGWVAMVPYLRGMPGSDGNFSLDGWRDDLLAAVLHLRDSDEVGVQVGGIWAVGFGTGAGLAICAAAAEPAIRGVGALATPADWSDWADNPRRLLLHARDAGLLSDPEFPADFQSWRVRWRRFPRRRAWTSFDRGTSCWCTEAMTMQFPPWMPGPLRRSTVPLTCA